MLSLVVSEQQHWFHVDLLHVIGGGIDVIGGTRVYSGHKHHKWYTDG